MPTTTQPPSAQHQLSDFLQAELLHTLGAYQFASHKLGELLGTLGSTRADTTLREVVKAAHSCNEHLRDGLHHPGASSTGPVGGRRHPSPHKQPPGEPSPELLLRVSDFYNTAATALSLYLRARNARHNPRSEGYILGRLLAVIHDPQRRGVVSHDQETELIRGRLDRTLHRLAEVNNLLPTYLQAPDRGTGARHRAGDARSFREILGDHMGLDGSHTALHLTVLECLSDAHMWMHHAEHLRSQSFGAMFTEIPQTRAEIELALRRSLVLNTFVYVVGRSMPWVFSENERERDYVVENYEKSCATLTPTYCMWMGNQLNLLALHRRAYTWWTLGEPDRAYRDFYKVTRFLRDLRRRVEQRAVRVPGTMTLIEGLTAIAEHHIGRIYRGRHAHRVALKYFDRASMHLKGWEEHEEIGKLLRNSRWRLNLLTSQGKANYELGHIKRSLLCYARAWRAFLLLADSESHSTANTEVVTEVIKWLAVIEDDPQLSKTELSRRLEPLVKQFETVYSPVHLSLIAADIMMRLGHLLFILRLPPTGWVQPSDPRKLPPAPDHALAHRCLLQAAALDPASTLIAADLLKIRHDARGTTWKGKPREDPPMKSLAEQWPYGGGRFEEAARVIEYILQLWLADSSNLDSSDPPGWPDHREIARELLGSFLAHTDSSNVKLAQVYRYLMQQSRDLVRDTETSSPTIDVVCLRRYSSFFPFLPRPAAFRSSGGGYLVQVCDAKADAKPFGIAVDPGPDFIENLYRCGYALADVHMIVLTHDHADHIASVDALLALMGIRMILGDKTFSTEQRLTIVGNKSVVARYRFYNKKHPVRINENGKPEPRGDAVRVMNFEDFYAISRRKDDTRGSRISKNKILLWPANLCIEPIQTIDHYDATGHISQGFLLRMGSPSNGPSVLFTGDTGSLPPRLKDGIDPGGHRHYHADGTKTLKDAAVTADLVVAHLSSVPLRELRDLAGLATGPDTQADLTAEFTHLWEAAVAQAQPVNDEGAAETEFLLKQLQFGFRTRADDKEDQKGGELGGKKDQQDRESASKERKLKVSPLSPLDEIKEQSEKHLYLTGLLELAEHMARKRSSHRSPPLLLIGELREELGTFRTRIASRITESVFQPAIELPERKGQAGDLVAGAALTADIGLRVRLSRPLVEGRKPDRGTVRRPDVPIRAYVLCTTCDLDNDLITTERFHRPSYIREVCVKGENEGVFYNCLLHDPGKQPEQLWVESVERFDVFGN